MEPTKSLGFSEYLGAVRRRRWLAARVAVGVFLFAVIVAIALPDRYVSTAVFQLRESGEAEAGGSNSYADRYVSALTEAVLSADSRKQALSKLQLYPNLSEDPGGASAQLAADTRVQMVTEKILDPGSGRERNINTGFNVTYRNHDPAAAKAGADWLAQSFLEVSRNDAARRAKKESQFFASEAESTRSRIDKLAAELAEFKRENFQELPDTAQSNLAVRNQVEQELGSVEREQRSLQQNRVFLLQQLQTAKGASPDSGALFALQDEYRKKSAVYDQNHPDMAALRQQIQSLQRGAKSTSSSLVEQLRTQRDILEQTRQRYSDEHPDVVRLNREIDLLQKRIARGERVDPAAEAATQTPVVVQLQTQLNATDTQLSALQRQGVELRARLSELDQRLSSTPQVERQYEALTRDLATAREQYAQLNAKRMESDVKAAGAAAGTADRFRLVEPPVKAGTPAEPKRGAILLLGFLGAIGLACMAILTAEIMDTTVRGSRDVTSLFGVIPLATIPEIQNSGSRRLHMRQVTTFATSVLVGVPVVYFIVRMMV